MGEPELSRKFLLLESMQNYPSDKFLELYPSVERFQDEILTWGEYTIIGFLPTRYVNELFENLKIAIKPDFRSDESRLVARAGDFSFSFREPNSFKRVAVNLPESVFYKWWKHTEGRRVRKFRLNRPLEDYDMIADNYIDRPLVTIEMRASSPEDAEVIPHLGLDITGNPQYTARGLAR